MTTERREPTPNSPGQIMGRMAEIEVEMAELGNRWSNAAHEAKRLDRVRKKREAQLYVAKKGHGTIDDMKAAVQDEMWQEVSEDGEPLMEAFMVAEASDAGCLALYRTLDRELSSLQTRLQALVRIENAPTHQQQTGVGYG